MSQNVVFGVKMTHTFYKSKVIGKFKCTDRPTIYPWSFGPQAWNMICMLLTTSKLLVAAASSWSPWEASNTDICNFVLPCMVINNKHRVDPHSVTKVMLQFTDYNMKKILACWCLHNDSCSNSDLGRTFHWHNLHPAEHEDSKNTLWKLNDLFCVQIRPSENANKSHISSSNISSWTNLMIETTSRLNH